MEKTPRNFASRYWLRSCLSLGKLLGNGAGIWLKMKQALDVWTLEQQSDYTHIQQLKTA